MSFEFHSPYPPGAVSILNKRELAMPLYIYNCTACGDFQEIAAISQFAQPQQCPSCGLLSDRALTTPQVSTVSHIVRRAHSINERSASAPTRAKLNGLTPPRRPKINNRAKEKLAALRACH